MAFLPGEVPRGGYTDTMFRPEVLPLICLALLCALTSCAAAPTVPGPPPPPRFCDTEMLCLGVCEAQAARELATCGSDVSGLCSSDSIVDRQQACDESCIGVCS